MDLIYTDENNNDLGVIKNFKLDLAYGKDENNFELEIDIQDHCAEINSRIYIQTSDNGKVVGSEYGGIIDNIEVDADNEKIVYSGRTWHGILANKIIQPENNRDYYTVTGDANTIIADLIEDFDLADVFEASREASDIDVLSYDFRYVDMYSGLLAMLDEYNGKLIFKRNENGKVEISVVANRNYASEDEFYNSEFSFVIKRAGNPTNHMICLGAGDMKERKVIHLFANENNGIEPYTITDEPKVDEDYILDERNKVLTGSDEVTTVFDYPNAGAVENYILQTAKPDDWEETFSGYVYLDEQGNYKRAEAVKGEADEYSELNVEPKDWGTDCTRYFQYDGDYWVPVVIDNPPTYEELKKVPSDWGYSYKKYFEKVSNEYISVTDIEEEPIHQELETKPENWKTGYGTYYTRMWDGAEYQYSSVHGEEVSHYKPQTKKPTDWKNNYKSYYFRKGKDDYVNVGPSKIWKDGVAKDVVPKWQKNTFYTYDPETVAPQFVKNKYYKKIPNIRRPDFQVGKYYKKIENVTVPPFEKGKYWKLLDKIILPEWKENYYYEIVYDNYQDLAAKGVEKFRELLDGDEININLKNTIDYDIGDVVGATDTYTGISVIKKITKKIVTIKNNEINTSYEIG